MLVKRCIAVAYAAIVLFGIATVSPASAAMTSTAPVAFDTSGFGNVDSDPGQISCWSPGNCAAVGYIRDVMGSGNRIPFVAISTNGVWSAPFEIAFPSGIVNGDAWLKVVSCTADSNCAAAGIYQDQAGDDQGFVALGFGPIWTLGQPFTFGGSVGPTQYLQVNSIDCAGNLDCSIVGQVTTNFDPHAYVINSVGGSFGTAQIIDFPVGVPHVPNDSLEAVSCAEPGGCTAIGYMSPGGGNQDRIFSISSSSGVWGIPEFLPFGTGFGGGLTSDISCPTLTNCTTGGWTYGPNSTIRAWIAVHSSSGWSVQIVDTPSDGGGSSPWQVINSVSCSTVAVCIAAGRYLDSTGTNGFLLTTTDGWATFTYTAVAGNANGVSCTPSGPCLAVVGENNDFLQGFGGREWTTPLQISSPSGITDPSVDSLSCTNDGVCGVFAYGDNLSIGSNYAAYAFFVTVGTDPIPTTTTTTTSDQPVAPAFTG